MKKVDQLTAEHRDRKWVDNDGWVFVHMDAGRWLARKNGGSIAYNEPVGHPLWDLTEFCQFTLEQFEQLPLAARMRAAGKVATEAARRLSPPTVREYPISEWWSEGAWRHYAAIIAEEDERRSAEDSDIQKMSIEILDFENDFPRNSPTPTDYAKFLYEAGYRKVDGA